MTSGGLLAVALAGAFAFQAVAVSYLIDGIPESTVQRLLLAIALYLVHGAVGIAVLIYYSPLLSTTPAAVFGIMAMAAGWLGLGLHALFHLIPGGPKPRWMTDVGLYDVVCLLAIGTGFAFVIGLV